MNPGIGSRPIGNGITEHRGKNGGRILTRQVGDDVIEILGKSGKDPSNQSYVIKQAKNLFTNNKK